MGWKTGWYRVVVGSYGTFAIAFRISEVFLLRIQDITSPELPQPRKDAAVYQYLADMSGVLRAKLSAVPDCEISPATMGSFFHA